MEKIKQQLLPGNYIGFYPKYNEETNDSYDVFKYALTGSKEALAEYERITLEKGQPCHKTEGLMDEYGIPDGRPIFFTLDFAGDDVEVKITVNGKIVANDETLRQINSLTKRTSGIMQEMLAKQGVEMLLGQMFKKKAVVTETEEPELKTVDPEDVDLNESVDSKKKK